MTDKMPDKMFAFYEEKFDHFVAGSKFEEGDTEYTRTDLVEGVVEAARAYIERPHIDERINLRIALNSITGDKPA